MNLEDSRLNQFVIRIYDMNSKLILPSSLIGDSVSEQNSSIRWFEDELPRIDDRSIFEYKLATQVKYFQADTSYVKLQ